MQYNWISGRCLWLWFCATIHALFEPEYTKAVTYTVENVDGGIGREPTTEVTHLGLNQPPVYSGVHILILHNPHVLWKETQLHYTTLQILNKVIDNALLIHEVQWSSDELYFWSHMHCKKLEIDLTQQNVISVVL